MVLAESSVADIHPPLSDHVCDVIPRSPEKKMIGAHASGCVAMVAHVEKSGVFTEMKLPRQTVRPHFRSVTPATAY